MEIKRKTRFKMRVAIVDLPMIVFLACVIIIFISTPLETTNVSDTDDKVMPTKSKEQIRGNNSLNTTIVVSKPELTKNSSNTAKVTETRCKEQIGTNNLNTTNLACVNHTMSLQNIGNKKKSVQNETNLYYDINRSILIARSKPPCPNSNETRTDEGTCTTKV